MTILKRIQALGLDSKMKINGFEISKTRGTDGFVKVILKAEGFESSPLSPEDAAEHIESA
jgi:hypothetical protein